MASSYDIGDLVRVSGIFTNTAGAATDPTAIKVSVRAPDGTLTTYTYGTDAALKKETTGSYYLDIDATLAGFWFYRWFGTGAVQAADEAWFEVVNARAK